MLVVAIVFSVAGIIGAVVLFGVVVPCLLIFGKKGPPAGPAAEFSLAEVREQAELLNQWFQKELADHPQRARGLGVGPELAKELARLAALPVPPPEATTQFADRVRRALRFYAGLPFIGLLCLSHRLKELSDPNLQ
jgi:hypothetical protein